MHTHTDAKAVLGTLRIQKSMRILMANGRKVIVQKTKATKAAFRRLEVDPHRMRALESVVGQLWPLSELVLAPSPSQDRSVGV